MKLAGTFSRLGPSRILVIGDLILDTYTIGKVKRISPEAPVGVVHVSREDYRPGGAGNVVLNLISMGADVVLVGRIGQDIPGKTLLEALNAEEIDTRGVVFQKEYPTPVKNRIIADNQQIVRIDHEQIIPLEKQYEQQIIAKLPELLKGIKTVAISDYGKGFLTPTLLQAVISEAKKYQIPVIADPKGIDFTKYAGATLIKPNLREAYEAAKLPPEATLDEVAAKLLKQSVAEILMVTRSEAGISLFFADGHREDYLPTKAHEVKDVTGAGDTVLAMISCALANQLTPGEAAQLANVAAGIAIERFGCARITLSDLAQRLLEVNIENKLFDEEHLYALKQALQEDTFCIVGIHENPGLTPQVFEAIQKQKQKHRVLVYLRDREPSDAFVRLLASLRDIDFIITKKDSLQNLCALIQPEQVFIAETKGITLIENVHDLIRA